MVSRFQIGPTNSQRGNLARASRAMQGVMNKYLVGTFRMPFDVAPKRTRTAIHFFREMSRVNVPE